MLLAERANFTQFLIEERRRHPDASGDLNSLLTDVLLACKTIAKVVAQGSLAGTWGDVGATNVQGEEQKKLDVVANEAFLRACEWGGNVAGMVSEEMETPYLIPARYPKGKYLLIFDPLDGSSNIDVNVSVGSIFSVLRAPHPAADPDTVDFLQPGARQVAAGYAIYGPTTMLVLTLGRGVHGFTLEPNLGEFMLTHPNLTVAAQAREFAINASNSRFWEPAIKRYVDECVQGKAGPRGKDFNMRWVASLVAEAHRILMRGGVFMYPRDNKDRSKPGRLRLLYEANPISLIMEQAGAQASTGEARILELMPEGLHQRVPFIFGAREEVTLIERYHREAAQGDYTSPLFNSRGLFAAELR